MLATCAPILYDLNVKDPSPETKFPIHLRVTFKRPPKTYTLRFSLIRKDFDHLLRANQLREEYQHAYHSVNKATHIIRELKEGFSWDDFENRFFARHQHNG